MLFGFGKAGLLCPESRLLHFDLLAARQSLCIQSVASERGGGERGFQLLRLLRRDNTVLPSGIARGGERCYCRAELRGLAGQGGLRGGAIGIVSRL